MTSVNNANRYAVPTVAPHDNSLVHLLKQPSASTTTARQPATTVRLSSRRSLRRYEEFEKAGGLFIFLNRPRGDSHRTAEWIEGLILGYYQEEDVERTCPNIAHALE